MQLYDRKSSSSWFNVKDVQNIHDYLHRSSLCFKNEDFEDAVKSLEQNAFVLLQPPTYTPPRKHTGLYGTGEWNEEDYERLIGVCDWLTQEKGIEFLLIQPNHPQIKKDFSGYYFHPAGKKLLITNYIVTK